MQITLSDIQATGLPLHEHDKIATTLSQGRTKIVYTEVGNGFILSNLGITVGNNLLDVLYSKEEFRHVRPLLEQGRLDVGNELTRYMLDSFVGVVPEFTMEHATILKKLAEVPDPVSALEVARIVEGVS